MGGGDLNLKKQWHPAKLENMQRVYEVEQKHKEEQRKLETLRKEMAQEKELQELQRLQEDCGVAGAGSTNKKHAERLDWMYSGGGATGNASSANAYQEEFLLGKRRVNDILAGKVEAPADSLVARRNGTSVAKDMEAKMREDPLFCIKKKEQKMLEASRSATSSHSKGIVKKTAAERATRTDNRRHRNYGD